MDEVWWMREASSQRILIQFEAMAPTKTHRLLNNVRSEIRSGKNRSRNGGREHTEEEIVALVKKENVGSKDGR